MSEKVQQMVLEMTEDSTRMLVAQAEQLKTPEARKAFIVFLLKTHVELGRFLERYDSDRDDGQHVRGVLLGMPFTEVSEIGSSRRREDSDG